MPESHAIKAIPTLNSHADQAIAVRRASEVNHSLLQDILAKEDCPEFHGYNTKLCREQGHLPQPKTKAIYLPLIDMKPSDPDTTLTAMVRVQELTSQTGQFIESTFMRYGHSVGGIIGITLKSKALKIWALSRHICCKIV